ncbi:MAG: sodium-dependent transporter [Acutalibacteraceae bacterium]|nr:sodium-dependent transporter [Acutalibacteraceae bacterium]
MEREKLSSRLGFILLSAGCAIGIGNVWKFPYMAGQYGGAIFVLIYIFFLIIMGIPVMAMEFSLGRAAQKSPAVMYRMLEREGSKWHWHGYLSFAGNYILMMFYTTVAGWMINYFVKMGTGKFVGSNTESVKQIFAEMTQSPIEAVVFMAVSVLIGVAVCALGVKKGVEKISKVMMLALLCIMVVLAINSCFLNGGAEGLKFYLLPNAENIKKAGLANVIVAAMNQAFFTLSLGIGSMAIFGSYLDKKRSLMGEAVNVAALDTFVALTSGLIIFPAAFAYGIPVDAGPNLIFVTLPNVFNNLPLGRLWGTLFFVFMSFAALSTIIAVFENIIACSMDMFGWGRKKACIINAVSMLVLSVPCALGFNLWSGVTPFGSGSTILDLEDFLVNNILLPGGAFIVIMFSTWEFGWGFNNFKNEANLGKGLKVKPWMRVYMQYVLPVMVLAILIYGLVTYNY